MGETETEVRLEKKINFLQSQINNLGVQLKRLHGQITHPSVLARVRSEIDTGVGTNFLKLDQTVPQTVHDGMPLFQDGLSVGPPGFLQCEGNIYIGMDDPTAGLQVAQYVDSINAYMVRSTVSDYSQFCFGLNTGAGYAYLQSTHDGTGVVLPLTFWVHAIRALDIAVNGYLGVNTIAPDVRVHIAEVNATPIIRLERVDTTIGTDDIVGRLEVEGQDAGAAGVCATLEAIAEGNAGETGWRFSAGVAGAVTEFMRLTYLGYLGLGTTEPDAQFHIEDVTGAVQRFTRKDTAVSAADIIGRIEFETQDAGGAGVGAFIQAEAEGSVGEVGLTIGTGVGGAVVECARISHHGNLSIGGTAVRGTIVGTVALHIFNGTAPTGTLVNGCSIYSAAGELYAMDAGGNSYCLTATVIAINGGTGQTVYAIGDLLYADSTTTLAKLADVAVSNVLLSGGIGAPPAWGKVPLAAIVDMATGALLGRNTPLTGIPEVITDIPTAITIGGAYVYRAGGTDVAVADGGTGQSSYAVGDLLYASAANALSKLADVVVGAYLRSGGVATAPLWSTLILPNAATAYRLPVAMSTNTIGELAAVGTTGEYLKGNTGAIPSWATLNQAAVAGLTTTDGPTFAHLHLSDLAAIYTAAESWVGPSSTTGIYFKGGFVGIGTTSPNVKLHVYASSGAGNIRVQTADTANYALLGAYADTAQTYYGSYGSAYAGTTAGLDRANMVFLEANLASSLVFTTVNSGSAPIVFAPSRTEAMRIADSGNVGIGTTSPTISGTGKLHMTADTMRLDTARTPASAGAAGNKGEICWDSGFFYICVAANSWKRAAIAAW